MNNYYVYRFKKTDGTITYVGRTTSLLQRFRNHAHLTDDISKIEYIKCSSKSDMAWKEIYYINLYCNKDTTNKSSLYHDNVTDMGLNDEWNEFDLRYIVCRIPVYMIYDEESPDYIKYRFFKTKLKLYKTESDNIKRKLDQLNVDLNIQPIQKYNMIWRDYKRITKDISNDEFKRLDKVFSDMYDDYENQFEGEAPWKNINLFELKI